ncbi:hypothetical protein TEA_018468 [Camellia sinensis var. sinensis]|uniref:Uncharacterized protein n=1 Tax=Camellia sinensis var. sinensis TaxID=542762 RepID=A0A4S4CZV3_CAMSN|nr:hypothetical protein TEA_018468 [Camellia sinensis var. sinensis]
MLTITLPEKVTPVPNTRKAINQTENIYLPVVGQRSSLMQSKPTHLFQNLWMAKARLGHNFLITPGLHQSLKFFECGAHFLGPEAKDVCYRVLTLNIGMEEQETKRSTTQRKHSIYATIAKSHLFQAVQSGYPVSEPIVEYRKEPSGQKEVHHPARRKRACPQGLPELDLLNEDANVYKLIGPVLVKQDLAEANANVRKRIDYISAELHVEFLPKSLSMKRGCGCGCGCDMSMSIRQILKKVRYGGVHGSAGVGFTPNPSTELNMSGLKNDHPPLTVTTFEIDRAKLFGLAVRSDGKRLDATLQDLEEKQNSKKDAGEERVGVAVVEGQTKARGSVVGGGETVGLVLGVEDYSSHLLNGGDNFGKGLVEVERAAVVGGLSGGGRGRGQPLAVRCGKGRDFKVAAKNSISPDRKSKGINALYWLMEVDDIKTGVVEGVSAGDFSCIELALPNLFSQLRVNVYDRRLDGNDSLQAWFVFPVDCQYELVYYGT